MNLVNKLIARTLPIVPRPIVGRISQRYIAGSTIDDAMAVVSDLNRSGFRATLDILGEFVTTLAEADRNVALYEEALERIRRDGVDANISVKLTSLGLILDAERCFTNIDRLVDYANRIGNWVRIDMEDSPHTDATLAIHERLRARHAGVGVVLQAYLKRTQRDAEHLAATKANVRMCKGIYVESPRIAYKDADQIRASFLDATRTLLSAGSYVGIATHDETLIDGAEKIVSELGLTRDQYEFQMLLGVNEPLREHIRDTGHRLRVYVPYGEQWYAYSLRRLKENPSIAGHILRATLGFGPERNGRGS